MDFYITDTIHIACKETPTKKTICEYSNRRFDFQCLAWYIFGKLDFCQKSHLVMYVAINYYAIFFHYGLQLLIPKYVTIEFFYCVTEKIRNKKRCSDEATSSIFMIELNVKVGTLWLQAQHHCCEAVFAIERSNYHSWVMFI